MRSRRRSGQRGATISEFALVGTVFFFFFVGLMQAGYLVFGLNAVTNGAREGARYGIATGNPQPACASSSTGMTSAVNKSTPGLGGVTISAATGSTTFGAATSTWCQVTVSWHFQLLGGAFGLPAMTFTSTSRYYDNNDLS